MILPFNTALGIGKPPYVTGCIIILCLVIHHLQVENRIEIDTAAKRYCASIHNPFAGEDAMDYLSVDQDTCREHLVFFHSLSDKSEIPDFFSEDDVPAGKFEEFIAQVRVHSHDFSQQAPASLDSMLSYDPSSFNPVTSLTSGLAHADWGHVIGNLIFFLAFAPAIELLVGSALRYIGILVLIEFACDITYSLISLGGYPVPTLGLSGVVMGVIGLSAYLMPWVRIRTLVWYLAFIRIYYIPAWILALWYAGWDTYDLFTRTDNGGVNLIAHVSGAIAGYLIGVFLLKERREDIRDELADEIDHQRSLREDRFGIMSTYKGGKRHIANAQRERQAKAQFNQFMDELYQLVSKHRDSDAIVLLLDKYELYSASIEIYEEIFWDMHKWPQSRALLCIGRLNISQLLEHGQYSRALAIAEACAAVTDEFILANPNELLLLAEHAKTQMKYHLAYRLVHNAEARYGVTLNAAKCLLMEADLLEHYLNEPEAAQALIDMLPNSENLPVSS